ncbi:hypothetical protein CGRA01v4_02927 [Colletotrichum graminicola]|nr:hypothetical protein CGRA01v4_02927 [Colletotrichum graminicola]
MPFLDVLRACSTRCYGYLPDNPDPEALAPTRPDTCDLLPGPCHYIFNQGIESACGTVGLSGLPCVTCEYTLAKTSSS